MWTVISKFFSGIKVYLYSAIGLLVTALLARNKYLAYRNKGLKKEAKTAQAQSKHMKAVITADVEADEQADAHLAEVAKEVEDGKHPKELTDPNSDW